MNEEKDIIKQDLYNYITEISPGTEHSFINGIISYELNGEIDSDIKGYPLDGEYYVVTYETFRREIGYNHNVSNVKYNRRTCIVNGDKFNEWRKNKHKVIWL